jgi:hypothetical protein
MQARIAAIHRYPLKGFSPEPLASAELQPDRTIAHDRAFAIENGPSGFDPAAPGYLPKIRFLMLMRNEAVAKVRLRFLADTRELVFEEPGEPTVRASVDTAEGRAAIERYVATRFAADLRGAPRLLAAPGHSFSDVAAKVLHLVNLESLRDLERHVGRPVDPLRFRPNVIVEGWPAWSELDLVGRTLGAGDVRFKVTKRTERCAATNVDPATGARDLAIPRTLMAAYGHTDFGVYVRVVAPGRIAVGSALDVEPRQGTAELPF